MLWQPNWDTIGDYLVVIGPAAVFMWRFMRRVETAVGISQQVATKHLPFIYKRLNVHDEALKLHSPLPPNIGLVNGVASRERE